MRWLSLAEAAERLDWQPEALQRLLEHTSGELLPGAEQDEQGAWAVPESALRRITGAGLFLFSIPTLARVLDASAETLRQMARDGRLKTVKIDGIGQRVPWSEYQRLTGRAA